MESSRPEYEIKKDIAETKFMVDFAKSALIKDISNLNSRNFRTSQITSVLSYTLLTMDHLLSDVNKLEHFIRELKRVSGE